MQPETYPQLESSQNQDAVNFPLTVDLAEMANFKQMETSDDSQLAEVFPTLTIEELEKKDTVSGSPYEVQPDDTFGSIARDVFENTFGYEPSAAVHKQLTRFIAKHNRLNDITSDLEPGQVLRMPSRETIEDHFNGCFPTAEDSEDLLAFLQTNNDS